MKKRLRNGADQAAAKIAEIDTREKSWGEHLTDPELNAVMIFSLIGLLLALNVMFHFPEIGSVIAQYGQF
jgi:hypothetical protein